MIVIPEKATSIDFLCAGVQNVGTMPDMRYLYGEDDPGREYAVSKPVLYNVYASSHLQSDPKHAERLAWIKENGTLFFKAIEEPEFIEKRLRQRKDGFYSATHFVKISHPKFSRDTMMCVAISLSKDEVGGYHQVTTIYPKRTSDIIRVDGTIKDNFIRVKKKSLSALCSRSRARLPDRSKAVRSGFSPQEHL